MMTLEPEYLPQPKNFAGKVGRWAIANCRQTGRAFLLLVEALCAIRTNTKRVRVEILTQMYTAGIKSLAVITIVALFTGMILSLQTGIELQKWDLEANIGTAVMASMLREMGPFMTGLILAACVGSAMAAQLGTMAVSEEISALEIMSINPVRFLVMPRLVAMAVMTPLLSFYTCILGSVGGGIVGSTQLGVPWVTYWDNALRHVDNLDLWVGILKAFLFGIIITTVACHEGLSAGEGAVGVGRATRRSVITAFLLVLITGYYITRIFYV